MWFPASGHSPDNWLPHAVLREQKYSNITGQLAPTASTQKRTPQQGLKHLQPCLLDTTRQRLYSSNLESYLNRPQYGHQSPWQAGSRYPEQRTGRGWRRACGLNESRCNSALSWPKTPPRAGAGKQVAGADNRGTKRTAAEVTFLCERRRRSPSMAGMTAERLAESAAGGGCAAGLRVARQALLSRALLGFASENTQIINET